jgi:hypothetical protein
MPVQLPALWQKLAHVTSDPLLQGLQALRQARRRPRGLAQQHSRIQLAVSWKMTGVPPVAVAPKQFCSCLCPVLLLSTDKVA